MATDRQKGQPAPVGKGTPKTVDKAARDANTAEVERSINEWRAMQGLPPRDQSKEARDG